MLNLSYFAAIFVVVVLDLGLDALKKLTKKCLKIHQFLSFSILSQLFSDFSTNNLLKFNLNTITTQKMIRNSGEKKNVATHSLSGLLLYVFVFIQILYIFKWFECIKLLWCQRLIFYLYLNRFNSINRKLSYWLIS